jgi:hypothetical protein
MRILVGDEIRFRIVVVSAELFVSTCGATEIFVVVTVGFVVVDFAVVTVCCCDRTFRPHPMLITDSTPTPHTINAPKSPATRIQNGSLSQPQIHKEDPRSWQARLRFQRPRQTR